MKDFELVFATNNQHKLKEAKEILGNHIQLISLKEINCLTDLPETGDTFQDNALQKASYIYEHYGLDCFADDSGLEVEALNGVPGVYSARYASLCKENQSKESNFEEEELNQYNYLSHQDAENLHQLLLSMKNKDNCKAQFRTVAALILNGQSHLFEGIIHGKLINEPRGENGFGYDPIFIPQGYTSTFSELPAEVKNRISHRALALQKLATFLSNTFD